MITDLFSSGNQELNFSAMVAASNASTKGKNLSDFSGTSNTTNTLDFAAVLSQTIGSTYLVEALNTSDAENLINKDSALSSLVNPSQSFDLNSQLKRSSFKTDTFNSSPFVNLSERNSFQANANVKSNKDSVSSTDTKAASDKKDSTVSKETKKDDTDKSKKVDSKEEDKNQKVDESNKEENVAEENAANEELAVNLEAVEETLNLSELVVTEEVVESDISVTDVNESFIEVDMAATTDSDEKTGLSEEEDKEDVEEAKVSTEEKTNPEIFAQNLQNLEEKTDIKEEAVEEEISIGSEKSENNDIKLKTANKEVKSEEHLEEKVEVKEEKPEEKLASEVISQIQQSEVTDDNASVLASKQVVDTENTKKSKAVEEETTEEVVEVTDETQTVKTDVSAKDSNEKSNSNQEKDSKLDKAVAEMKNNDNTMPEESLRQKFAEAMGLDKHQASENPDVNLAQQMNTMTEQVAQNMGGSSNAADETANKIFEALTGKSEGLNSKQNQTQNLVGNIEGAGKGAGLNQNNGSGMNNGFSFQSGTSQTYNESGKMQQTAHTPTANFSELLTKAEMVKTKDGAKVMNVELEQEGMGKLELELTSKNGEVTARLSAENDLAKAKLEELAPQIKENLQEKGVNLTQINVDVSSQDADGNSEKYLRFGKKGKSNRLNGVESTSVKDVIEEKILPNLRREALNIQSVDLTV